MKSMSVYIDAEYVIQSLRVLNRKPKGKRISIEDINWVNLTSYLVGGHAVNTTYYYTARLDPVENENTYDRQTKYLSDVETKLKPYNIKLRLNKMIKTKNKTEATWDKNRQNYKKGTSEYTWVQKGTDAKIVLDLIRDYYESDTDSFILVSGDEDFAEVLGYLREKGKEVIVLSFDRRDSKISDILANIPNKMEILTYEKAVEIKLIK